MKRRCVMARGSSKIKDTSITKSTRRQEHTVKMTFGDFLPQPIPTGFVCKGITGAGATYGICKSSHNELVSMPLTKIADSKKVEEEDHPHAVLIPIHGKIPKWKENVVDTIRKAWQDDKVVKLLCVNESLPSLINILENDGIDLNEFYFTIDEFHLPETEASYRDLTIGLSYYNAWPEGKRRMVSATPSELVMNMFPNEDVTHYKWEGVPEIKINFIVAFPLKYIAAHKDEYELIAYNSVDGILKIREKGIDAVLVADSELNRIKLDEDESRDADPGYVNFITSAYFCGWDFRNNQTSKMAIVMDPSAPATFLDHKVFEQVIGRPRNGIEEVDVIFFPLPTHKIRRRKTKAMEKAVYSKGEELAKITNSDLRTHLKKTAEIQLKQIQLEIDGAFSGFGNKAYVHRMISSFCSENRRLVTIRNNTDGIPVPEIDNLAIEASINNNTRKNNQKTVEGVVDYYMRNIGSRFNLGDVRYEVSGDVSLKTLYSRDPDVQRESIKERFDEIASKYNEEKGEIIMKLAKESNMTRDEIEARPEVSQVTVLNSMINKFDKKNESEIYYMCLVVAAYSKHKVLVHNSNGSGSKIRLTGGARSLKTASALDREFKKCNRRMLMNKTSDMFDYIDPNKAYTNHELKKLVKSIDEKLQIKDLKEHFNIKKVQKRVEINGEKKRVWKNILTRKVNE
jgi:hypothetical protein